jgi:hypothetical protein
MDKRMKSITRRQFVKVAGVLGVAQITGCLQPFPPAPGTGNGVIAYRRSGRGIKGISLAAKKHNANRVYATSEAAMNDLPHPGDKSRVVHIFMNGDMHARLFANGNNIADLRLL